MIAIATRSYWFSLALVALLWLPISPKFPECDKYQLLIGRRNFSFSRFLVLGTFVRDVLCVVEEGGSMSNDMSGSTRI